MSAKLNEFLIGERVQAHPACDCWMMGDRYGRVVSRMPKAGHIRVMMETSRRVRRFTPDLLLHIPDRGWL